MRELPVGGAASLRAALLRWYRRHRRDLPWRRTSDPYRIWVSEVMLQQTQVATAVPYYQRFLERFPTLTDLADARPADVLSVWSGLGYYRRARHLHEAARLVVREHDGRIPGDPERFARLPGVGRYTTGAVLSIAFDRPLPVLDGNVARVLSRVLALPASVRDPRGARLLWEAAVSLVPMRGAGDWNQALMELGARICVPRAPACDRCPVRRHCRARERGRVAAFPPAAPRRAPSAERRAVVLIERRGRLAMVRREGTLLGGLWEPPGVTLEGGTDARRPLRALLASLGVRARLEPTETAMRHRMTHRDVSVEVWRGRVRGPLPRSRRLRLVDAGAPVVPLSALARRLAAVMS